MVKTFFKNNWPVAVLLFLAVFTRFFMLNYPAEAVFDEVYFGHFAQSYSSQQYFSDVHPPLGKLMIFGFAKIFGFNGGLDFSQIGSALNSGSIFILRFLPALFSVFLVVLIYYLILKMKLSKKAAFLGAFLVLFDNAILAQSKFVLIDIFMIFFGFLSLYFLLCYKDCKDPARKRYSFLILAVVFSSLAFSIKWTGLSFLALIILYLFIGAFRSFNYRKIILNLILVTVLPFLVYYSVFAMHFSLLPNHGAGDVYSSLASAKAPSLWGKFIALNREMYTYHLELKASHPYSSKWYQWPFDKRPIWYWTKDLNNKTANIYLIGNPVVWWSALLAVITAVVIWPLKFLRKKVPSTLWLLLFAYFLSLLPFIFISRVAFLYHYLSALVFGILILAILYDKFLPEKKYLIVYSAFLSLVVLAFLLISPLTYGFPVFLVVSGCYNWLVALFL